MEEIRDNLGNLESCSVKLNQQLDLITLMSNEYFGRGNIELKDGWELAWDYKKYQSLLFVIQDNLIEIEQNFNKNVNKIYDLIAKKKGI